MKILNLYAGIGGNRKLWTPNGDEHEITAVELNPSIARIYHDFFPNDIMVVGDAHQYLLDHFKEFDFIWSSPPCPTHSNARFWSSKGGMYAIEYPDMVLYQEILLLKHFFVGQWVVENVAPYYTPLIEAKGIGRHLFWANFFIPKIDSDSNYIFSGDDKARVSGMMGFDLDPYTGIDKTKILRNCVHPKTGLHILNTAIGAIPPIQEGLFEALNRE